jgi:hypothetical protein
MTALCAATWAIEKEEEIGVNYWLEDFKKLNWTTIDIFQVTKLVCNFRKSIEPK